MLGFVREVRWLRVDLRFRDCLVLVCAVVSGNRLRVLPEVPELPECCAQPVWNLWKQWKSLSGLLQLFPVTSLELLYDFSPSSFPQVVAKLPFRNFQFWIGDIIDILV